MSKRSDPPSAPEAGQLVCRCLFGVDAVYRIVGRNERGIEVEVVDVEGLSRGRRFTFLAEEVEAMEVLPGTFPGATTPRPGAKPGARGYIRRTT